MALMTMIGAFAPLFSQRMFRYVKLLLASTILAPSNHTVMAVMHGLDKGPEAHFQDSYRVFNQVQWASLEASPRQQELLLDTFTPESPVVMDPDGTLERRREERIAGQGDIA
jgi:hypothetical protein